MEDSAKGLYITLTVIGVVLLCLTQFIYTFPLEQGINFSSTTSEYLEMGNLNPDPTTHLTTLNNQSKTGFDQWDVTQGFMGSNSIKQSSEGNFRSYISSTFTSLTSMATIIFKENSPVLVVLSILLTATLGYLIYVLITFIRTGR